MMIGNRRTRKDDALLDELLDSLAHSDVAVILALVSVTRDGKVRLDVFPTYYRYRGHKIAADETINQILRRLEKVQKLKIAVSLGGDAASRQQLTLQELLADRKGGC